MNNSITSRGQTQENTCYYTFLDCLYSTQCHHLVYVCAVMPTWTVGIKCVVAVRPQTIHLINLFLYPCEYTATKCSLRAMNGLSG